MKKTVGRKMVPAGMADTAIHKMAALPLGAVKVGGEIGRRIELTIANNLLKLDVERDFLGPLQKKDGANLRQLTIIPETVEGPFVDESVRPGGQKARVQGWKPSVQANISIDTPNLTVELTEFPDAGGEVTYFRVPNPSDSRLVADELLAPEGAHSSK